MPVKVGPTPVPAPTPTPTPTPRPQAAGGPAGGGQAPTLHAASVFEPARASQGSLPPTISKRLKAKAEALSRQGVPGVELMTQVMGEAVAHYSALPGYTEKQKMDAVMRDLAAVFLGPTALSTLRQYRSLPGVREKASVQEFEKALSGMDLSGTQARGVSPDSAVAPNLDPSPGSDFKKGFRDGSKNQVFHTFAYVYLSYVTDNPKVVKGANLKHELFDGGTSTQDYNAGLWGIELGQKLRGMRDNPRASRNDLFSVPALVGSALADGGESYGDPAKPWNRGRDFRELAHAMDRQARKRTGNPGGGLLDGLANGASRTLIRLKVRFG